MERYRLLREQSLDLVAEISADGICTYLSPNHFEVLGYRPEELIGRRGLDYVHPDDVAKVQEAFDVTAQPGQTGRTRFRARTKSGAWRWLDSTARSYRTTEGELRIVEVARDVTPQVEAEGALRESEQRLSTLISSAPVTLCAVDRDGICRFVGGSGRGRQYDRLRAAVGQPIFEALGASGGAERVRRALVGERVEARADIDGRVFQIQWAPVSDGEGGANGAIGVAIDITEQSELEAQVQQAQRMEAVGKLAAGVSHDLNNMHTVVLANLDVARLKAGAEAQDALRQAVAAVRNASDLSRQLLDIGRATRGPREPLRLEPVVNDVVALLRLSLGGDVEIEVDVRQNLTVVGNASRLRQVLINLAFNAADAMPHGGRLTIRGRSVFGLPDAIMLPPRDDGYALLEVIDTGVGMDSETQERMFDPFFTSKGESGSGLGAAVVYGIVREHAGLVTVQSAPGKGTSVQVYLPAAVTGASTQTLPPIGRTAGLGRPRALVVDDIEAVRRVTEAILLHGGYQVTKASSGEEALRVLRETAMDLVVLDCSMPGLSGRDVYRQLQAEGLRPKVLFMSGYTEDTLDGLGAGPTWAFLPKPFGARELIEAADCLVGRAAA